MIKMKALKSFSGAEGKIRSGREFVVVKEGRAADLVRLGMAERVVVAPVVKPAAVRRSPSFTRLSADKD